MKARNREINIFNMSLLDILCGALGAFCFMMLSLLPYYRPPGEDIHINEEQKKLLDSVQDIKDLAERLKNTGKAEDLSELLKQLQEKILALENEIKRLQGQVNSLLAENGALKQQNQKLEQEKQQLAAANQQLETEKNLLAQQKQKLENQLAARLPWAVSAVATDPSQGVDCNLVEVKIAATDGRMQPAFDPTKRWQIEFWPGDFVALLGTNATFVSAWRTGGTVAKLYYKLSNKEPDWKKTDVDGNVVGSGDLLIGLPRVTLTPERPWMFVGTFSIDERQKVSFMEASAAERDAEWQRLTKTDAPSAPQSPMSRTDALQQARAQDAAKKALGATRRMREYNLALREAKTDTEKRQILEKWLNEAETDGERDQVRAMIARNLGRTNAAPNPPPVKDEKK